MNRTPDDQLSKAAIKANLETLAYLERQQVKTAATIDTLRDMLRRAGVQSTNGAQPPATAERDDTVKHVKAVVERAKARFAATKRKQRPAAIRRSPAEWLEAIVQFIKAQGKPVSTLDIKQAFGGGNNFYGYVAMALRKHAIVKVGMVPRHGTTKAIPLYDLAGNGRTPARTSKKQQATKPRFGNKTKEQRARSLAILSAFDTTEPRPNPPEHMGKIAKLISHGYLKHKGEGYVRTAKEFMV